MIVYDFEVLKHDWLVAYLDTSTRQMHSIINDADEFEKFYEKYKDEVWVGYNSRGYDQWIAKAILAGFKPYDMSKWIIEDGEHGWKFSDLLHKFPIFNYDCSVGFRSLKELEAFMGDNIKESSIPFDIDRKLTDSEIDELLQYCEHDVMETFKVFVMTDYEFESHVGLLTEFNLPLKYISKTKAQLSAVILGASKVSRNDEFDITIPDTLDLGKYDFLREFYQDWADNVQDYSLMKLETDIAGVPHTFGIGGLHGAIPQYIDDGYFLMADVSSYYPAIMIEYDFLSRNVASKEEYIKIRDERLIMKRNKDPREKPRKIVLNGTFGASKDQYNNLYDPLQSNNVCISGQLFLVDLIDKLENECQLIQSNTDGILVKLYHKNDRQKIIDICEKWSERTRMDLDYDDYERVIQKDVNNYITVPSGGLYTDKGKPRWKAKGTYVKFLTPLDNDLPIVNRAIVDYFLKDVPVVDTIMRSTDLIDFQKIVKVGKQYEYVFKEDDRGRVHTFYDSKGNPYVKSGKKLETRVNRCFASKHSTHGAIYKKKKEKDGIEKIAHTPLKCFTLNSDINGAPIPSYLDKSWYIDLANKRIDDFIGR